MICVQVYSPCLLFQSAMLELVKSLGFGATVSAAAEVGLWDLTAARPPYPPPPPLPTVALISGGELEAVDLLQRRYRGYVTAADDAAVLVAALKAVQRGELWGKRAVLTRVIDSFEEPQLTAKEQEVFFLITKGWSNRAIGEHLHITEGTVKMHVSHLLSKMSVKRRTELIAWHFEQR